ncbi:MAG: molybdenum cofactor guanylyltransferase [Thermodesulfobacteriota bacterium]
MCAADGSQRQVTGVILAGGESRRFDYVNKAFFEINGESIVERVYRVMRSVFEDLIVVTNNPADYLKWDVRITTDIFPWRSSMTGVHAGLFLAETPFIFVCGCDTPFLKKEMIETVLAGVERKADVVVPRKANGWFEPLCAVYSRACLQPLERCLQEKTFDIIRIFKEVRVKYIDETVLRRVDPELTSFFNINTPEDLLLARKIANRGYQEEERQ